MTTPTIPDLPVANSVDDTDQFLVRQPAGALGTDKSATAQQIRNLNIAGLSPLPGTPDDSDLMLISRGGTNYKITFQNVGFLKGVKMWFYMNAAGSSTLLQGWSIISNEDTLLAVKGGSTYTVGGTEQGQWQQDGYALEVSQIPPHKHRIRAGKDSSGSSSAPKYSRRASNFDTNSQMFTYTDGGGGQAHDHGDSWRPRASVGILCEKL